MITGKTLQVVPKRLIIQSWRGKDWVPEDVDSTLILSFWPDKDGGRIKLEETGFTAQFDNMSENQTRQRSGTSYYNML